MLHGSACLGTLACVTRPRQPVIDLGKLPTEKAEIAKLHPVFPRLAPDSPGGCPLSMVDIKRYVTAETGRKDHDLFFGRTAIVGDVHFWLWGLLDAGDTCYVDVSAGRGRSLLSMGSGVGLTPEQYIALRYARQWRGSP
ncbi:MAG TPA: hypothetical protein VGY54_10835, partial [Polyangiaceae bacterium]|jgi:hypothetical protein|nr:hypothetical protein [Polyangiaceae bacterium]